MSPFHPRFLNRDASFFDLCLYALWPRQFQSRDNFSSPAKTVRHALLCLYFDVSIIVSPLPPRFLKHLPVSSWRAGASQPSRTAGSDFSIYITGAAHTVIPIQRQHAHKIAISVYTCYIQCTRDRYRRKMRLASESAEEEETRLSRRRGSS